MTEKEIAKSPENTHCSDHSDRAFHQTAQEAVVGDDKNQSLHHKAKLSDNQHNLSDPTLLAPKEGESIDDYRKRVEAIQNNRFEITGLEEGTNSPQDKNDKMTTAEVKVLGGKDAEMMFDAINKMPEGPEKDEAKEAIKNSYTEVLSNSPQSEPAQSKLLLEGHISNTPESDTTEKIGWLDAAQKISQLPLDKQLQVIGAGLSTGITEQNHQQREESIGAVPKLLVLPPDSLPVQIGSSSFFDKTLPNFLFKPHKTIDACSLSIFLSSGATQELFWQNAWPPIRQLTATHRFSPSFKSFL